MSFLPTVQREIHSRRADDPVRITLEYLMQNAVGRRSAVPLESIIDHLRSRGVIISRSEFQHTILGASRGSDYFIGSSRQGCFLIDTIDDAREMAAFYVSRIQAEEQNLRNLRQNARQVGWTI